MKYALAFIMLLPSIVCAEVRTQHDKEVSMILEIARFYNLTRDQAILMLGIYEHEKTPKHKMKTYGNFGIRKSCQPIIGHCKSDEMLFIICAGLCAKTIKLRCKKPSVKTIKALNHGYKGYDGYAEDRDWYKGVLRQIKKYKDVLY